MDKQKENLIELIHEAERWGNDDVYTMADILLANGVIVPPCKVGDTVYEIRTKGDQSEKGDWRLYSKRNLRRAIRWGEELYIKERAFTKSDKTRLGRTVFLSREDAEKALEERL